MPRWSGPQQAATGKGGAKKEDADEALGRSRGGLTTKIHLLADALGRPLRLLSLAAQVHDSHTTEVMLQGVESGAVIADKAMTVTPFATLSGPPA